MPIGGTAFLGANQHPRITTRYLNDINRHGDVGPGLNVGGRQDYVNGGQVGFSGSIAQPYAGFNGGKLTVTGPWAQQLADPAVGPLYGGVYQYVQFDPLMPWPAVRGAFAWWKDELNYIVTTGYNAATAYKPAGVILNLDYPGNWDFVQIGGIAMTMMSAVAALGAQMQAALTTTGPSFAEAGTGPTGAGVVVLMAGAASVVSPLELNLTAGWNY